MTETVYKPTSDYNSTLVNNPVTAPPRNNVFIVSGSGAVHITVGGKLLYNVSAGKNLYITGILIYGPANGLVLLTDQGQIKFSMILAPNTINFPFNTPLRFTSEVFLKPTIDDNYYFTITGYEE